MARTLSETNSMFQVEIGANEKNPLGASRSIAKHSASIDRARIVLYPLSGKKRLSITVNALNVAVYVISVANAFAFPVLAQ